MAGSQRPPTWNMPSYSNSARYTYHLCMCLCNVNSISFLKNSFHVKSVQNFSKYFLKFENYFNDTTFLKYFTLKTKFYKYTIYTKCGYLAICCESWISFLFSFEYKEWCIFRFLQESWILTVSCQCPEGSSGCPSPSLSLATSAVSCSGFSVVPETSQTPLIGALEKTH